MNFAPRFSVNFTGKISATLLALSCGLAIASAQVPSAPSAASPTASPATAPAALSSVPPNTARTPVDFFRQLLTASPAAREPMLASRPATERALLLAKVREYEALTPAERELRLNATQMRWHLKNLLPADARQRAAYLAALPPAERAVLEPRLKNLEQLPPRLQSEARSSQTVIHYYSRPVTPPVPPGLVPIAHQPAATPAPVPAPAPSTSRNPRQTTVEQFRRFFELNDRDRARALERLPEAERQSLEQLMQELDHLPGPLRTLCMDALQKFATLSPREQAEFLRSASRWQALTPGERETWRDFVTELPPLPPGFGEPPLPPGFEPASAPPPLPKP